MWHLEVISKKSSPENDFLYIVDLTWNDCNVTIKLSCRIALSPVLCFSYSYKWTMFNELLVVNTVSRSFCSDCCVGLVGSVVESNDWSNMLLNSEVVSM